MLGFYFSLFSIRSFSLIFISVRVMKIERQPVVSIPTKKHSPDPTTLSKENLHLYYRMKYMFDVYVLISHIDFLS